MAETVSDAFQYGELYSDNHVYYFLKFPVASVSMVLQFLSSCTQDGSSADTTTVSPFNAFILDKDEITIMISSIQLEKLQKTAFMPPIHYEVGPMLCRLITFDVVLAPTLVGFMAVVTKALAAAKVSVLPFAAYSRDHIFVSEQDYDTAMRALNSLTSSLQSTPDTE